MTDSMGWVCPKCSKVYGPHVMECHTCNATVSKQQQAIPNQIHVPSVWLHPSLQEQPSFIDPFVRTVFISQNARSEPIAGNVMRSSSLFNDTRATSVAQVI